MTGADASHAARQNFAALLHELGKNVGALVINHVHLFRAELANFLFAEILTLAATRAAWAAARTSGTAAFTASAATATRSAFTTRTAGASFAAHSATATFAAFTWSCGR